MRRRWVLLVLGLPIYMFLLMVAGTCLLFVILVEDWSAVDFGDALEVVGEVLGAVEWWAWGALAAAVVTALQAVFLIPMFSRTPPRDGRGRSLTVSLILGGLVAAILTMGLGAAVVQLIALVGPSTRIEPSSTLWLVPLGMLVGGWAVWSLLLLLFARGIWADRTLGRLVGLLFAGTLLEALVVLPLDLMVRRRTDCYCGTGTFVTLTLSALAGLWLTGPGIVIALTCRKHRRWRTQHCAKCGYAKGPSPGARCAECGYAWDEPRSRRGRRKRVGGEPGPGEPGTGQRPRAA